MEEANLSLIRLMEQSKFIAQQLLRVSEDLELAHERISILERDFENYKFMSQNSRPNKMSILHSKATSM
ncbi:hypothetical protein [Bacteroides fluxus]|jgi:hypothetical protein|uniref:hypothetical protein n=1 Tax=Bacteroides fluxus TaxID=626930 RepID=UPI002A802706|nr:hypothetical protein [Bacteroides fluxus]MDY3790403.1 hypothetical protein [Bacteroides fluxus]